MNIPYISKEKRDESLKKARYYRAMRAVLKNSIKKGLVDLKSVLAKGNPDSELIANMKLIDLMKAMPGTGDIKALKILKSLSISSRKTVRGLSKKQFESLEKYFDIS